MGLYVYTNNKCEKGTYVKKYDEEKRKVTFADGITIKDVAFNEIVEKQVNAMMERQVKDVRILTKEEKRELYANIVALAISSLYTLVCFKVSFDNTIWLESILFFIAGSISLPIDSSIIINIIKSILHIKQLKCIEYRNNHLNELNYAIKDKSNLNGLSKRSKKVINSKKNPFSLNYINYFKLRDLTTIINNNESVKKLTLS